jgi:hypothetical protein
MARDAPVNKPQNLQEDHEDRAATRQHVGAIGGFAGYITPDHSRSRPRGRGTSADARARGVDM